MDSVLFSHKSDDWRTPSELYEYFTEVKGCIDPFPYESKVDNLHNVYGDINIFINPPFSKLKFIPNFVKNNINYTNTIYLLMPVRTDTRYFEELYKLNPLIIFFKGRLRFSDSNPAPFPCMLLIFRYDFFEYTCCNYRVYDFMSVEDFIRSGL